MVIAPAGADLRVSRLHLAVFFPDTPAPIRKIYCISRSLRNPTLEESPCSSTGAHRSQGSVAPGYCEKQLTCFHEAWVLLAAPAEAGRKSPDPRCRLFARLAHRARGPRPRISGKRPNRGIWPT